MNKSYPAHAADAHAPADERIADYTTHLAHDLNNVFSVVIGSLGLVLDEYADRPLDDEGVTLVEDAVSAGREGARLIEALLSSAGRQALRRQRVEVAPLVTEIAEVLRRTSQPRVRIETDIGSGLACAWTDPDRLRQCLLAIAANGCEAMPDGGTLRLETTSTPATIELRVVDTGAGMTAEVASRAREPFFTTHSLRRGRGLGLSVADGFARQCDGALSIRSQPGAGTTVTLSLPTGA